MATPSRTSVESPSPELHRPLSPAPFASSSTSNYTYRRPSSPTRINLNGFTSTTSSPSRFSIASRSGSPRDRKQNGRSYKKTCMCSPTTHPGSFRCSLHKNQNSSRSMTSHRLNARRSAMTNSLVRISAVEGGDLVKRALAALIRPSSHHQRRRLVFEPRPSRLSLMSKADGL